VKPLPTTVLPENGWISRYDAIELCGSPNPKTFDRWRRLPGFPKARTAGPGSRLVFFDRGELLAWMAAMTLGSHQTSIGKSQAHFTPRWIIDTLGLFDLDPCAGDPRSWKKRGVPRTPEAVVADFGFRYMPEVVVVDVFGFHLRGPPRAKDIPR
jgi:hypothetical protein